MRSTLGNGLISVGLFAVKVFSFLSALMVVALIGGGVIALLGDNSFPEPFGAPNRVGYGTFAWQTALMAIGLWLLRSIFGVVLVWLGRAVLPPEERAFMDEVTAYAEREGYL